MYVVNKMGPEVKKLVLRKSRVEVQLADGTEKHYYVNEAFNKEDDLSVFSTLMRDKFLDGRDRLLAQGLPKYKGDTIWELQGELLDVASYSAIFHADLARLKESARTLLAKLLNIEKLGEESQGVLTIRVDSQSWDDFVSDLEKIVGRK